jgi:hypothetical protein
MNIVGLLIAGVLLIGGAWLFLKGFGAFKKSA